MGAFADREREQGVADRGDLGLDAVDIGFPALGVGDGGVEQAALLGVDDARDMGIGDFLCGERGIRELFICLLEQSLVEHRAIGVDGAVGAVVHGEMQGDDVALIDVADHHDERALDVVADHLAAVDTNGHVLGIAREIRAGDAGIGGDVVDVVAFIA